MTDLFYVPLGEFERLLAAERPTALRTRAFAALCRINTLYMVKRAGSGHLGTSFSSLDVTTWLHLNELRPGKDVFFSSKGHDVPALYSVLAGLGRIPFEQIHRLRRLGGLPGHPEVPIGAAETNTGSLGMGISKAKGMAHAFRLQKKEGRIFVLTGDGELQEGQIWESLPSAAHRGMREVTAVVDHNKIQSDTWVRGVSDLGDVAAKWRAFGWHVERCDGHDVDALASAFRTLQGIPGPRVLIADTVKGRGVSFMERFGTEEKFYNYHSGAPTDDDYARAHEELHRLASGLFAEACLGPLRLEPATFEPPAPSPLPRQRLVDAYSAEIVRQARANPRIVALDADLIKDCGLAAFARELPDRLIECGIAEQDMVSQAGGLALKGMLPVVHSFAAFLSARPNEQIYTNATERTRIVYVGTLAGLLPGTPGFSHQAVRDISSLGAVPGMALLAPGSEAEVGPALDYCLNVAAGPTYLRLCSIPCVIPYALPADHRLSEGRGAVLAEGRDGVIFSYGPVMLSQAFWAAEAMRKEGVSLRVVGLPWLNRVDSDWLRETVGERPWVFTLDDHYVTGGQGDMILSRLAELGAVRRARKFGVTRIPACGQNDEVLRAHRLDAESLAEDLRRCLRGGA